MGILEQLIDAWRANEAINRHLLENIPDDGLLAVPLLKDGKPGRGRNVARVFHHIADCRMYHMRKKEKEAAGKLPEIAKGRTPTRRQLDRILKGTAKAVEMRLAGAFEEGSTIHTKHVLRFLSYLIAHDSHHRGQVMLALKQNGIRVDDEVKWGLWGRWFKG